jgi:sugar O-acyltransferase (sialic acid O-acetyltransferase NeuD family)
MGRRIIVVGARNFAREIFSWIKDCALESDNSRVSGFISDYPDDLNNHDYGVPILGSIRDWRPQESERFLMGIGSPEGKLSVGQELLARGAEFISLIHPTAIIGKNVELGRGCVLCPYAVITCDVTVGDFVSLNVHATVGHDAIIGDGCTLSSHVDITGFVKLGKGVFVGSHATVAPHVEVGDFATIGIGSAIIRNVKPRTTVIGVPGKTV